MLIRAIGLVAAFLLAGTAVPAFAAEEAGTVLAMAGESFVASGSQRTPIKVGDKVHVGDQLEVADNAKVRLQMTDGSIVTAAAGTTLKIEAFAANGSESRTAKFSLLSGLLRAVVSKMSKPSQFEVDTATGVAAVRSTDWFIRTDAGSTQVGVLKGVVSLASRATDRSVDIPARWGARVEAGKDPVPPRVWQKSEFEDVISRTDLP
ncbi:MAG TPA: FecR family protein [Alphaproteobacteria bacterium]|jgi:hypothetical protein|nr:FecR family protein [Alphaproteobacteria bacterium]